MRLGVKKKKKKPKENALFAAACRLWLLGVNGPRERRGGFPPFFFIFFFTSIWFLPLSIFDYGLIGWFNMLSNVFKTWSCNCFFSTDPKRWVRGDPAALQDVRGLFNDILFCLRNILKHFIMGASHPSNPFSRPPSSWSQAHGIMEACPFNSGQWKRDFTRSWIVALEEETISSSLLLWVSSLIAPMYASLCFVSHYLSTLLLPLSLHFSYVTVAGARRLV